MKKLLSAIAAICGIVCTVLLTACGERSTPTGLENLKNQYETKLIEYTKNTLGQAFTEYDVSYRCEVLDKAATVATFETYIFEESFDFEKVTGGIAVFADVSQDGSQLFTVGNLFGIESKENFKNYIHVKLASNENEKWTYKLVSNNHKIFFQYSAVA